MKTQVLLICTIMTACIARTQRDFDVKSIKRCDLPVVTNAKLPDALEQTRNAPVFSKIHKKIVTRLDSTVEKINNLSEISVGTKLPLMRKLVLHNNGKRCTHWEDKLTRRPIMKLKRFTTIPQKHPLNWYYSYRKLFNSKRNPRKEKRLNSKEVGNNWEQLLSSSEEMNTEEIPLETNVNPEIVVKKQIKIFEHGSFENDNKIVSNNGNNFSNIAKHSISDSSEEDKKEFIFLNTIKTNHEGIKSNRKIDRRHKRGVIEEENFATTISGYKFTGDESRLNNHLVFKNINI